VRVKRKFIIQQFVLVGVLSALFGCGGSGGGGSTDVSNVNGDSSIVHGIWKSECFGDSENIIEYFVFDNGNVHIDTRYYNLSDTACSGAPYDSSPIEGTYEIGNSLTSTQGMQVSTIDLYLEKGSQKQTLRSVVHIDNNKMHFGSWLNGEGKRPETLNLDNTRVKLGEVKQLANIKYNVLGEIDFPNVQNAWYSLDVKDNLVFVTNRFTLYIIDVSDTLLPKVISSYDSEYAGLPVAVGNYVYLFSDSSGVEIVDVTDETTPVGKGIFNIESSHWQSQVTLKDNYLFIGHNLLFSIIDVSNPLSPKKIGSYDAQYSINAIDVTGDIAVLNGNRIAIVDISDKYNPHLLSYSQDLTYTYGNGVVVKDNRIYSKGLVLNIEDPFNSFIEGWIGDYHRSNYTFINNYLVSYWQGLEVFDVSNSAYPRLVDSNKDGFRLDLVEANDLIFQVGWFYTKYSLQILQIDNN